MTIIDLKICAQCVESNLTMTATEKIPAEELPLVDSAPAPKRRKLRKGTQSCWECKRRKARCTFSPSTQEICDGCKRRGSDCVSQEVADLPPPPGSNKHIVDRLGQVEALVRQLIKSGTQREYRIEERPVSPAESQDQIGDERTAPRRSASSVVPSTVISQPRRSESPNDDARAATTLVRVCGCTWHDIEAYRLGDTLSEEVLACALLSRATRTSNSP